MTEELFELELVGGSIEKAYRQMRPEVEAMPWGTLDPREYPEELIRAARKSWTGAAFQEHRTGAACAATLQSLIEARAPLDLIALASRFPLDEMVHVELCSRIAMEFGGGAELTYEPDAMVAKIGHGEEPLMKAAHQVVAFFCVGEALSIPLLHGTWKACTHPLTRAVLKRIVTDEADHGTFGWAFLDWVLPHLEPDDFEALGATADLAIAGVLANWEAIRRRPPASDAHVHDLGWMQTDAYLELAERSLQRQVMRPLSDRGIPTRPLEAAV
ncbi:MAG: hypothetical protein EP330_14900 [Deltaproteobacteria bacterium]|nr:MAG: hypothetical protein EP330_14900 [Deltaproteobacteria bacterium]